MFRTEYCGLFTKEQLGKNVFAGGWVLAKRDMGGIIFIDLGDKEGVLQLVFDAKNLSEEDFAAIERIRNQSVISVGGLMRLRDEETRNPKIPTGDIELYVSSLEILSKAASLPFSLEEKDARDELRLKYRYLDLRRPKMQRNLRFRHGVQKAAQDFLDNQGFTCVETPMLTKSTPEGARDYVVPSRVHKGSFYALPQSPQIFKQLLMVGGVDRYYQVARCFRDEDLRADRQPEFTQVDMEMSFVTQEDILVHLENMFKYIFKECMGEDITGSFPRMTWKYAMDTYGSDKPDLRFDLPIVDLSEVLKNCEFQVFKAVLKNGGTVRAINVPGGAKFTRSEIEQLTEKATGYGAKGMAWIAVKENGEVYSILSKFFSEDDIKAILKATNAQNGDFVLFCADSVATVRRTLGGLRKDIADMLNLRKENDFKFLIITDFPQFEYSEEEGRFVAMHHPFTMPYPEDVDKLESDPGSVRAQAYDFVLNGVELGSGSLRIYSKNVQNKMFKALGFTKEEAQERFGFMVNAFSYGTPPHGGFAFGLDRLVMLLLGEDSLREVIAFPKTREAYCLLTDAPSLIEEEQLEVLGLNSLGEAGQSAASQVKKKTSGVEINIDKIAHLSRLWLDDTEKPEMEADINEVIAFVGNLDEIDTDGVDITARGADLVNVMRDDVVLNRPMRDEILQNAPESADGYILVPKVLD